jgi:hypothetical protein
MLYVYEHPWDLDLAVCPCDAHFVAWLRATGTRGATIFHFGTGTHHLVGTAAADADNAVLAITASPGEHDAYVKLVTERPEVAWRYKVLFGDIYQLDARLLPRFAAVTLFHLCEFRGEINDAYGALTDLDLATLLADRLEPGGRLFFYKGSMAFAKARPVIDELARRRPLIREPDFETLEIHRLAGLG